jgi:hypothetical protein
MKDGALAVQAFCVWLAANALIVFYCLFVFIVVQITELRIPCVA